MREECPRALYWGHSSSHCFTNEMTQVVMDSGCKNLVHLDTQKLFTPECESCGSVTLYADDATFHVSNKQREHNQNKLIENLEKLNFFLNANCMTINMEKTKIVEIMIKQKNCKLPREPPKLTVINSRQQTKVITDSGNCRILGMNIQGNLTWNSHLETGVKPLLPTLRKNLGLLKSLGKKLPPGSRNTLATGFLLSRINYLIGVWGGAPNSWIIKVQSIQNAAARWVSSSHRRTRISTLLELTGWMSVAEMTTLSTITQMWKIIHKNSPSNLAEKISVDPANRKIKTQDTRLQFTRQRYLYRASENWNKLPQYLWEASNNWQF